MIETISFESDTQIIEELETCIAIDKIIIRQKDKEIERLNNIINELENYIVENSFGNPANNCCVIETYKILDKLQKLKEANVVKKIV